jgi:hypothetical protein
VYPSHYVDRGMKVNIGFPYVNVSYVARDVDVSRIAMCCDRNSSYE